MSWGSRSGWIVADQACENQLSREKTQNGGLAGEWRSENRFGLVAALLFRRAARGKGVARPPPGEGISAVVSATLPSPEEAEAGED